MRIGPDGGGDVVLLGWGRNSNGVRPHDQAHPRDKRWIAQEAAKHTTAPSRAPRIAIERKSVALFERAGMSPEMIAPPLGLIAALEAAETRH